MKTLQRYHESMLRVRPNSQLRWRLTQLWDYMFAAPSQSRFQG